MLFPISLSVNVKEEWVISRYGALDHFVWRVGWLGRPWNCLYPNKVKVLHHSMTKELPEKHTRFELDSWVLRKQISISQTKTWGPPEETELSGRYGVKDYGKKMHIRCRFIFPPLSISRLLATLNWIEGLCSKLHKLQVDVPFRIAFMGTNQLGSLSEPHWQLKWRAQGAGFRYLFLLWNIGDQIKCKLHFMRENVVRFL